jgi:hypothetical protein
MIRISYLVSLSLVGLLVSARPSDAQSPNQPTAVQTAPIATTEDPSKDDFLFVEKEPTPITPLGSLVEYPETARTAGLEGRVSVDALIDRNGSVMRAEVASSTSDINAEGKFAAGERSAPKILEDEAVRAVMSARFTPAME